LSVAPIGPLARGESPVLPAHSMSSRRRVPARSGRSAGRSWRRRGHFLARSSWR